MARIQHPGGRRACPERSRNPPGKQATRSVSGRRGESEVRIYDSLTILTPEFLQKLT
ncbi:MAG: hypothetical protein RM022_002700 [Nostoc sp. EfeVER01]|nr:hypothetical protein [Nostoc sp. EfeVER01]MDZ7945565.1 hypothetical protein [Nostoc sp. EfeVER01]